MKRTLFHQARPAVAMIELIFAIVIIGIVLMSAPNLIRTVEKSGYVAIQQEAINEAAAHLNMVIGYHWDENDANESFLDPVLHVTSGDSGLDEVLLPDGNKSGRRAGTPKESYRKFIRSDGNDDLNASTILGLDSGESKGQEDDIDDFNGEPPYHLSNEGSPVTTTCTSDYVEKTTDISITTMVSYASDSPGGGGYIDPGSDKKITFNFPGAHSASTNIKKINVTLTSNSGVSELQKTIILKAFSCNIGATKLEERHF
ncbi:type II secretion system protein [Nitratifractor salsuginis]|uniref:Type II secretion system protein n=1 Tax=Nitratifractor salsuginis (strain DSM 16511 / JCM 12458 / E9I37-1) TaxID=749222 RepID=E6X094_NITSE|nr:type II secretion system protein [Nitratifractor salsuginis]ADV45683.1 hypothetical protein Nitsa_0413 [Nitratifractor salsuginis DSM 16511]